ncbi:hypothetical protein L6164_037198 [Bauhinia variegata]|uniref:Uncharacterized protein n=1 Tax=Bauhinia variegata TaxID=167791 RepID=A0ACB9KJQ0_BAUVA|nr:hypothetical protein L6164_037198 [Bauhinia variegata]
MGNLGQKWVISLVTLLLALCTPYSDAYTKTASKVKSAVFYSPKVELSPGISSNKFYYDVKFPEGHVALKSFNGEVVDEEGNSVPLYEVYLHHWLVARYHKPINSTSTEDIVLVKNAGVCQGNTLPQYFGIGSETRKTATYIPDPFGVEIGNPVEIPPGYEEKWMINLHAIDTRGVEDRWGWGCTECRCNLYNVTTNVDGQPLPPSYKGDSNYVVFINVTVLGILVLSGIILLPVLPVAITDNVVNSKKTVSKGTFNELDHLSMGNIKEKNPRLWAFLIATYWVSFFSLILLWKGYKHVSVLLAEALKSPEIKPEQFAIVVRDIPKVSEGQTKKDHVDSYFRTIYPETFYRSMIVTNNKAVNKIWEELEGYRKKLARAKVIFEASKKTAKPEGTRPTNKTGFLGLIGKKVDSIEYYSEKIDETIPKLESDQKITLREKQQNVVVVFFNNRVTAASAAQSLHAQMVNLWTVIDAPERRQILWPNLKIKFFERQVRQYVVCVIVALTIFFYMIPDVDLP